MEHEKLPKLVHSPDALHATFASDPAHIAPVRTAVEQFAAEAGFDEKMTGEIGLVVNEAVANVIRHAYGSSQEQPIQLNALLADNVLSIHLRDWGNGVHPQPPGEPIAAKDPMSPGGLGLICMRNMMDEVVFTPQDRGMLLTMRRRLP